MARATAAPHTHPAAGLEAEGEGGGRHSYLGINPAPAAIRPETGALSTVLRPGSDGARAHASSKRDFPNLDTRERG